MMLNFIVIEPTTWERLKKTDEPETDEKWVWIYQIFLIKILKTISSNTPTCTTRSLYDSSGSMVDFRSATQTPNTDWIETLELDSEELLAAMSVEEISV